MSCSSTDSLFSEKDVIPGLYVFPEILPSDVAVSCLNSIAANDLFLGGRRDQVMLFGNVHPYLVHLLDEVQRLVELQLPESLRDTLFRQKLSRQVIINLYTPGRGITSHVDLPHRYADGILGVSLCGGCVMEFSKEETKEVYLPPRSVYVLSGEARWDWAHSIPAREYDVVEGVTMLREARVSVTFRWMKEGADVLE